MPLNSRTSINLNGMRSGKIKIILAANFIITLYSCSASRHSYNPYKKFTQVTLQDDFRTFRHILEEGHPSLYWYTSKDSINYYFDYAYSSIRDSMTEPQFRTLLSYTISKINCGHTSARYSKNYIRYLDTVGMKQFPLSIKLWDDSAVVYANLNRKDYIITRGTVIKSIDGRSINFYRDSLFQFISMDGHGIINKYQTLSNIGTFSGWYRNVFGLNDKFVIGYMNNLGEQENTVIPVFNPKKDSSYKDELMNFKKPDRKERKHNILAASRELNIDTTTSTAFVALNTFIGGKGIRGFIKRTFSDLHRRHIKNLVIDVRNNGGGNVGISNLLTKLLIDHRFKLADSLYAINRKSAYGKFIGQNLLNRLSMTFITRKRADGYYHFGYFERHYFNPKKHHHFNGNVYVIIGGNSFSATSIFAYFMKGQKNVKLVGEETGGGAYGNTAWLIPDVTLPNTKVRFTLPKFRMVIDKNAIKSGRGVMPDVFVRSSLESIKQEIDPKIAMVKALIDSSRTHPVTTR
jgi:hypothetical protein